VASPDDPDNALAELAERRFETGLVARCQQPGLLDPAIPRDPAGERPHLRIECRGFGGRKRGKLIDPFDAEAGELRCRLRAEPLQCGERQVDRGRLRGRRCGGCCWLSGWLAIGDDRGFGRLNRYFAVSWCCRRRNCLIVL